MHHNNQTLKSTLLRAAISVRDYFEEELEKPKRKRHRSSARGYEEYAEDMSLDPDEFAPPDPDEFTEESQRTAKALLEYMDPSAAIRDGQDFV